MPVPEKRISQMEESEEQEAQYIFSARMDNARNLTNVLKAIHFKDVSSNTLIFCFPQCVYVGLERKKEKIP